MFPREVQQPASYLALLLLVGLVLSAFAFGLSYLVDTWKIATDTQTLRQIVVNGEGKIVTKPDLATFTAAVVTQSAKIKDTQKENTSRSNEVLGFLKSKGIEEKDLKTVGYFISPQYQYDSRPCIQIYPSPCSPQGPPKITSYEVRHTVEVKVRDLNKVDELLSGVVEKGANEVGSISFSVDDEEKVKAEVREKAIEDAKAKAEVLADQLGVKLRRIVSFSESGGGPIYARTFEVLGKGGGGNYAPSAPQVEPGEQEIRVFVTIVYEFR